MSCGTCWTSTKDNSKANLDEKILFGSIPHLTVLNIGHILFIPQPSKRRNFFLTHPVHPMHYL